ncbi:flagellin [Clostridium sp. D2Q-14]|uniref:flagellin N-terminal helical domain-containing protein n=1 Tax=Anaeromonas gelatinilytica TaxID=2683194 RepID=UPI00193C1F1B|nr:flagellin [Anaeromonas gelatinilytica]MBS4535781.1 flagellin [Anaeromonas gelatinilytica]
MRINHNLMAMNSHRQLGINNNATSKSLEKLSSGHRINRAGDDAAGLSISEKMRGQIRGLNQASSNAQDGISLIQTAEGALNESHAILQRMRELSVQAASDTNEEADRDAIVDEVNALKEELTRIGESTQFNKKDLLTGSLKGAIIHIGANKGENVSLSIGNMTASGLGLKDITVSTQSGADAAIATIDAAIEKLSGERSGLGALQNRLEHTIKNLDNASENLQSSESRIRDVDMAEEMMSFTKNNILSQAAQAMLAQANQQPQQVLQLLR